MGSSLLPRPKDRRRPTGPDQCFLTRMSFAPSPTITVKQVSDVPTVSSQTILPSLSEELKTLGSIDGRESTGVSMTVNSTTTTARQWRRTLCVGDRSRVDPKGTDRWSRERVDASRHVTPSPVWTVLTRVRLGLSPQTSEGSSPRSRHLSRH